MLYLSYTRGGRKILFKNEFHFETSGIFYLYLNPIIRGGFDQRLYAGGGSKSPDSVKSITGREILCENEKFSYLFYVLNGIFGHVWEMSKSIGAQF